MTSSEKWKILSKIEKITKNAWFLQISITVKPKGNFAFCFRILKVNRKLFNITAGFGNFFTPSYQKFRLSPIFCNLHKMELGTSHVIKLATIVQFNTMMLLPKMKFQNEFLQKLWQIQFFEILQGFYIEFFEKVGCEERTTTYD